MNKLPDEKELKALVAMAKEFEAQIKEQSEIARKIAVECEEVLSRKQKEQKA
ncbi:conserved hypothetical protein [Hyella patelloides LEGE 07179]|uniref:Uncharacterized protein n=1 Tax=Hyella patelloides LEGE 07179 TaxID=945734 RepID=A0A563W538_9CYAN|nr:hypothetical protein [Hyella patelloides]VEP18750.1 conserved hypothetical protein [Hyella patelloides LEGE 07179]